MFSRSTGVRDHETYFPAQPPPSQEDARFPHTDGDQEWTTGAEAPSCEGSEAVDCLELVTLGGAMPSQRFAKVQRVRRREEFQRVFDSGYKISSRYFTLLIAPGSTARLRLGIVASRKLGDAVRRNRAKRLIREVFRRLDPEPSTAIDLVVVPRRELFDAPFADLDRDFRAAWRRGRIRVQPAPD